MWSYDKRLQYPVKIANTNAALAKAIISQYGGPDGELGASLRYLSQRYTMPYEEVKGILNDIGNGVSKWRRNEIMKLGSFIFARTGKGENRHIEMLDKPSEVYNRNIFVNVMV